VYPIILGNNLWSLGPSNGCENNIFLWPFAWRIYMAQVQGYVDPKYLQIYSNAYMVWSNHQGCDMNVLILISSLILDFIKKW
jgi:hypothetical protein